MPMLTAMLSYSRLHQCALNVRLGFAGPRAAEPGEGAHARACGKQCARAAGEMPPRSSFPRTVSVYSSPAIAHIDTTAP